MTVPDPAPKALGPSLRLSITLLVVGAVAGVLAGVQVGRAFFDTVTATTYDAPAALHLHLDHGRYTLFERQRGNDPIITAGDVHVRLEGGGPEVPVGNASGTETITRGSTSYEGTLELHVPASGTYEVRVASTAPTRFLLTRGLLDTLRAVLAWVALGVVAGMVLVAGVVCLIVGIVRRA